MNTEKQWNKSQEWAEAELRKLNGTLKAMGSTGNLSIEWCVYLGDVGGAWVVSWFDTVPEEHVQAWLRKWAGAGEPNGGVVGGTHEELRLALQALNKAAKNLQ